VALVAPRFHPATGGVETHVRHLARHLPVTHEVEILTQHVGPLGDRLPARDEVDGVVVRRFRSVVPSEPFALAPGIGRHLLAHRHRYDIVHAHGYHATPALVAALCGAAPLVVTPHYHGRGHTPFRDRLHPLYRHLGSRVLDRAAAVIAVSRHEAGILAGHFPRVAGRLSCIPNGVDDDAPVRGDRVDVTGPVVLSVGRLERYKRVDAVVRAVAAMGEPVRLAVVGTGPAAGELRDLAERVAPGAVTFTGRVGDDELWRWYRTAAVVVSLSADEAFGLTLVEGARAGAAVVASDVPAHREVADLLGGHSVRLVAPDAPDGEVAAAIAGVLRSPRRPAQPPTWSEVAARTASVYHAVLAGTGTGAATGAPRLTVRS
jgi:glycosyltransferase involved in cell wall biosynthesis